MIDPSDKKLSIRKQAKLLGINRNRLTTRQTKTTEEDRKIMKIIDELYMECPFYGQRNLRENLRDHGYSIGRKRVRRLMRIMGIEALVPKPSTSVPAKGHEIFPYLLRKRVIDTVDEVWCADITYIPMEKGHAYLVAIMDWHRSYPATSIPPPNRWNSSLISNGVPVSQARRAANPVRFTTPSNAAGST